MNDPSARAASVAAAYWAVGLASLSLAIPPGLASPIWPAAGLAVAAALVWGREGLLGVFAGAWACNATILWGARSPMSAVALAALIAAGSTLQAGAAAALARRVERRFGAVLISAESTLAFAGAVGAATLLAASTGTLAARLADPAADPAANFLTWWLGDMLGILLAAPILLGAFARPSPRRAAGLAAAALVSAAVSGSVFFLPGGGPLRVPHLSFATMVVVAVLLGRAGAAVVGWTVVAVAIAGSRSGLGPFAAAHPDLASLQGFMASLVMTGLTLAGANERLEERVRARTSELERAVGELKRSNEDLQQFAYAASHDLKEPLRKIASFLELLQRDRAPKLDDQARVWIGHAVSGAERLAGLVDDLLEYAQVGRDDAPPFPVDLGAAAREALDGLAAAIAEAGAEVRIGRLPTVPGRAVQMRQLLQNLLSNALKFRDPARPLVVEVFARRDGDAWAVSVRDNGIGIEPEHHERIFGVFKRLHPADKYPGTGVGLALARRIAQRHGGRLTVDSRPGEGSTFTFTIPGA